MGNDPVNNVDPDGGFIYYGINWLGVAEKTMTAGQTLLSRAISAAAGAVIGGVANAAANGWNWSNFGRGTLIGGAAGLGATYVPWDVVGGALGDAGRWIGREAGGVFQGGITDWDWLDKKTLMNYTQKYFCPTCSSGQIQAASGFVFENTWHKWAEQMVSYTRNRLKIRIGNVEPDGFSGSIANT